MHDASTSIRNVMYNYFESGKAAEITVTRATLTCIRYNTLLFVMSTLSSNTIANLLEIFIADHVEATYVCKGIWWGQNRVFVFSIYTSNHTTL